MQCSYPTLRYTITTCLTSWRTHPSTQYAPSERKEEGGREREREKGEREGVGGEEGRREEETVSLWPVCRVCMYMYAQDE